MKFLNAKEIEKYKKIFKECNFSNEENIMEYVNAFIKLSRDGGYRSVMEFAKRNDSIKTKIVVDTNILLSAAFNPKGDCNKLIKLQKKNKYQSFVSEDICDEYYNKMGRKLIGIDYKFLDEFIKNSCYVEPKKEVNVCRDVKDNMFLSCAKEGDCKYIVSGDSDLLDLDKSKDIKIIKVKDFLIEIGE